MIKREEAHNEASDIFENDVMPNSYLAHELVDTIYDSIGSCGECINYTGEEVSLYNCILRESWWRKDDYCSGFERKEDD